VGDGCNIPHYVPDVFLMSIILFMGTFLLSVELKDFKNALFFPSKVETYVLIEGKDQFYNFFNLYLQRRSYKTANCYIRYIRYIINIFFFLLET